MLTRPSANVVVLSVPPKAVSASLYFATSPVGNGEATA